jgi:protein-disulfide isomerase
LNRRVLLAGVALGLALLAGGLILRSRAHRLVAAAPSPAPPALDVAAQARQDRGFAARTKGSQTAPITVYEIADFQCPACRTFWEETMPALEREYVAPGKVRVIFLNLPLQEIHSNAAAAHQFAMCAADQAKFWPVHDRLFDQQEAWARLSDPSPLFLAMADHAGLDRERLDACLVDERIKRLVLEEREGVIRAGVKSTPSFIIQAGPERALFPGAAPIEAWRPILDSLFEASSGRR